MGVIRILLAICVFCAHSQSIGGFSWIRGDLAVELFFVISGFYMQLVITEKYTLHRIGPDWRLKFWIARYGRLLPVYLMASVLTIMLAACYPKLPPFSTWVAVGHLPNGAGNILVKIFLAFANLTIFFQDIVMFLVAKGGELSFGRNFQVSDIAIWQALLLPQAWSLGIEISFYMVAPFLLHLRSRIIAAFLAVSLAIKLVVVIGLGAGDPWTYRFFPFEVAYFLLGALVYRHRKRLFVRMPKILEILVVYSFVVVFSVGAVQGSLAFWIYPFILAATLSYIFRVTSNIRMDKWLGELSYPFYMFHNFAIRFIEQVFHYSAQTDQRAALCALFLTLVLSVIGLSAEVRFIEPWRARLGQAKYTPLMPQGAG